MSSTKKAAASTASHLHRVNAGDAIAAKKVKKKAATNGHSADGHGFVRPRGEHGAHNVAEDATGVAGAKDKAVWGGRSLMQGAKFESAKPGATEYFTRVGVDAGSTSRYRGVSAENDTISVRLETPDFNLTVPSKDDRFGYVVFPIAEGATAERIAKDMATALKKERGYRSEIKPNARTGGVDLKVFDKNGKPVKITDRMTAEMPGLGFRSNTVSIPKIDVAQKPGEISIELGKKKLKLEAPPFEPIKKTAERIAKAVADAGYKTEIQHTKWGTDVKVFQKGALTVDVHPVQKEVSKLFDAVAKYAEVSGDAMAAYALRVEPARLKALEKGDPTDLKIFLLKATHGIQNFEYELGDAKDISGRDVIKGRDVYVPDVEQKEKHLRPKDGYTWKILEREDVYPCGLRYIFEDDDPDFLQELAANAEGQQENRAKLEEKLKAFEQTFLAFPATSFHMIRMPDQGVGSSYAVLAMDSKHGVVRVAGNYFEPGGPPEGAFG